MSRIKVLQELPKRDKYGNKLVECVCPFCSSSFIIRKSQVKTYKSCGCQKGHRKKNKFIIRGPYTEIVDSKGNRCLIDTEDLDKIKNFYWYQESRGYWVHHMSRHKHIYLHRYVLGIKDPSIIVDHIFHNTNDNRKSKLRPCSSEENHRNIFLKTPNKLGHVGVYETNSGKYKACVSIKGKEIRLGVFNDLDEAISAREEAADKFYGEFKGGRYVK